MRGDPEAARRNRRARDDPELMAEGVGEGVSTASVAAKAEVYWPRLFGFKTHEVAKLKRWQGAMRDKYVLGAFLS